MTAFLLNLGHCKEGEARCWGACIVVETWGILWRQGLGLAAGKGEAVREGELGSLGFWVEHTGGLSHCFLRWGGWVGW